MTVLVFCGGWTRGGRRRAYGPTALAALAAGAVLFASHVALADDAQALEQARVPFDAGQFAEAHARLSELVDPKLEPCESAATPAHCRLSSPDIVERARALDAAALLALKRNKDADETIATILRQNPNYVPSTATFPQEVIDRFTFVRGSMASELRKIVDEQAREAEAKRVAAQKAHEDEEKWIGELEKLASKERWVQPNSRWVALIPFGVGQFQNGDTGLGITFAVTEALALGVGAVTITLSNSLASVLPASNQIDAANSRLSTYATINRVAFGVWGGVTLIGLIHAQVAFVPEKVTFHDRPIPPRPKLVPIAAPLARGGFLGLGGTF